MPLLVYTAMREHWGDRCAEHDPDCACCRAWDDFDAMAEGGPAPVPMRLHCPECGALHIDEGEFATKPHHTHACQDCGMVWRPAIVPTVGVQFLPGFKNEEPTS